MKKTQLITAAVTLALVAAVSVGGTLAIMSAQSQTVTNTFTVGEGIPDTAITLDEAALQEDNRTADPDKERVPGNSYTDIEAGDELDKDPTVHIAAGTADCYLFVEVKGINAMESIEGIDVAEIESEWIKVSEAEGPDGIYRRNAIVKKSDKDQDFLVFDGIKVGLDAVLHDENGEAIALPDIVIKACAVQAKNVDIETADKAATDMFRKHQ